MTSPELDTDEERRSKSFKLTGDADLVYVGPHGNEVPRAVITGEVAKTHKIQSLHEGFGVHNNLFIGGHFGRDKTLEKVTSRYYWRGLANDVLEYVKQCEACQKSNNTFDKKVAKLHPIPVTSVWHQVRVDMIGPLPETISGNKYVITLCDYFSKWPEAVAVRNKTAKTVANFLFETMAREPLLPVDIEESMVHPESPTDCSDAQQERVYQSMAKSREKIKGLVKGNISKAQERQKKNFDKRHQSEKNFKVGSSVLVRNARKDVRRGGKLENSWLGPYKVKDVNEKGLFTLINSSTGLPLKKKFNSILLKEFHTTWKRLTSIASCKKPEASIISTNTPNEEQSNLVTVKLLPNLGNTCYMAAALQLFEGSGIIQHYDGHSSELMEVIKALFHATSTSTSWDPCLARLKQILPEFDSTAQEDALEFLGALYTSSCTSCNQSQCKLLDEYFFLHTTNEMKCTSCNETWHSGANSYPVIPIYPSNKSYMSRLSMQGHLEIFLDCQDLEGLCDSCGSSDGLLVSPSITSTPEVISIGYSGVLGWG
ncbi:putative gypsy retrotransposon integrase-like protein 1-like [Apostichopus japonicus]|uniref:Putative gypsy retrotransposon integrase-like protein 1-like n=1 Tax=Stichopus japonicus TaxID=307972 RepID=A0A2G8KSQ5_STIJA|nr:putative gypsy retrotransposon integrase-like protein 1-like [Apostichopus japonicus]